MTERDSDNLLPPEMFEAAAQSSPQPSPQMDGWKLAKNFPVPLDPASLEEGGRPLPPSEAVETPSLK